MLAAWPASKRPQRPIEWNPVNPTIKKTLKPVASLTLTVILLLMSIVLVFVGTSAQKEMGIWDVQHRYFHSVWCWVPLKYFFPLSDWLWDRVGGGIPFFGGYTLITALLVNLLAAHTVRFKFNWKRSGVLMIHFGLILLLVGELATSRLAVESQMPITEGSSINWTQDIRDYELAVVDPSPKDHDQVAVVPAKLLQANTDIKDPRLPFDIHVDKYLPNSEFRGPMQGAVPGMPKVTAGINRKVSAAERPVAAVGDGMGQDLPSAYLTFRAPGLNLGTYLFSVYPIGGFDEPQPVTVDGKTYQVALRFKRLYKPYSVHLFKFTHAKFVGTDMARDFASQIRLDDPVNHKTREVTIRMNEPLRYNGETFYQASFDPQNAKKTVLQVVYNPGWLAPYFACAIGRWAC